MTTVALTYRKLHKKIQAKAESVELPSINWKIVFWLGLTICSLLLIYYVWQINELTRGTYLINSLEKQINVLSRENKSLSLSFAESSFWGQALEKIQTLNFQKATSIKYIHVLDNSVAINPK
jgi:hypothetical protein